MSKEKRIIKETARDICRICRDYVNCNKEFKPCILAEREAEALYNAGYRKQSEGEWIDLYKGKYANPLYACSVCEKGTLLRVEGNELGQPKTIQALSPYCPNCGAKMRKEDEGK